MFDIGVSTRVGNQSVVFGEQLRKGPQRQALERAGRAARAGKLTAIGVGALGVLSTAALAVTLGPIAAVGAVGSSIVVLVARDIYVCSDNLEGRVHNLRHSLFGFRVEVKKEGREREQLLHGTLLVGPTIDLAVVAAAAANDYSALANKKAAAFYETAGEKLRGWVANASERAYAAVGRVSDQGRLLQARAVN